MLTAGIACYRAWLAETQAAPAVVAGHSLGEYTRARRRRRAQLGRCLAAGALSRPGDAGSGAGRRRRDGGDPRPRRRGGARRLRAAARETGEVVQAANFNDPKQTVIAGSKAGVDKACELLKAAGAKRALLLSVSAPFHSPLMKPAAERLRERLATMAHRCAVHPGDRQRRRQERERAGGDPRRALSAGLRRRCAGPRRSRRSARAASRHIFECGPGKVLAGMVKRIDADAVSAAVFDPASLADGGGAAAMSETVAADARQVALVTGASRGIGRAIAARAGGEGLSRRRHGDQRSRRRGDRRRAGRVSRQPRHRPRRHRRRCASTPPSTPSCASDGRAARPRQQRRHHARHALDAHEGRRLACRARHQPHRRLSRQPRGASGR